VTDEEFNRLITEMVITTKNGTKDIVYALPNRRLLYNAQLFHSKFPQLKKGKPARCSVCFIPKKILGINY
jgi:hypothetical protein